MTTPYFSESDIPAVLRVSEKNSVTRAPSVMVNGTTIFTITGGPIHVYSLVSECVTANNATASTLQWSADGDLGAATTFSGASASLASAAAGTFVIVAFTLLSTPPVIAANGVALGPANAHTGVILPAGIITTVIGTGSTTGTWRHYLRYRPLANNVFVSAAF